MSLPEIAIRRPVFTIMMSAVLVIFGLLSYFKIGLQETPNFNYPVITVTTDLPGANPALIDQTVSKPMESVLNTIPGILHMNTTSSQGESSIELQFNLKTDMDAAFNSVESKINQIQDQLPSNIKPPLISKVQSGAEPILLLALYGDRTQQQLNAIARNIIKPKLENISGVGSVTIEGAGEEVVQINLDLNHMAAMNITPQQVQSALAAEHVQEPGGNMQTGKKEYSLNLNLEFHTLDALKKMIVAYRDNAPILLNQIATVNYGVTNKNQEARFNGKTTVGVSIVKKSDANTVAITKIVDQRINRIITPLLPNGVKLSVIYKASTYILEIIHSLEQDVWLSIFSAGFIIWLFLRNFRSTAIIVTAIPISLLGVVLVMYFINYTFNVISLLGIILLVGVVVDDAIVVLENIHRVGDEKKMGPMQAAVEGSHQVLFAVFASSLTLICIFVPVVFMGSIIGLFFKSFAVVVSTGVILSLFVSLTLTPMLCSRVFKFDQAPKKQKKIYVWLTKGFDALETFYKKILHFALHSRRLIILFAFVMILISLPLFMTIGKAFMPEADDNGYFYITIQTPQGSNAAYTRSRMQKVEVILSKYQDIQNYFATVSKPNIGNVTAQLVPIYKQKMPQKELMTLVQKELHNIPGAICFVSTNGQEGSLTFAVLGSEYNPTINNAITLYNALQKYPQLGSLYLDLSFSQPEYVAQLDRPLANSLGISARDFAGTMMVLGSGVKIAKFNSDNGIQHDIILRATPGEFTTPQDVAMVYLPTGKGDSIRLDTIANLSSSLAPVEMTRMDMNYSVNFSTTPTVAINKAIKQIMKTAQTTLPKGFTVALTGQTASLQDTIRVILGTFFLIILLIYMVLASQFNSFIQPLIILVAQPLALIGGILVLWLTHQTLNIYSMIGMLLLMGLVAKNSILLIDLTNTLREQGYSIVDALSEACPQRMRPVLMTSLAIIFAMLPSAFSTSPGSNSHRALSLVIIGGMISSTILTLIVVPALYSLIEGGRIKLRPSSRKCERG